MHVELRDLPGRVVKVSPKAEAKKILVLDTGEGIEQDLAAMLRWQGHFPIVASIGEVLRLPGQTSDFDAFYASSMRHPAMSEVVGGLRDRARSSRPICVVLTGDHSPQIADKARGMGFDHVVRKPAGVAELFSLLE